MQRESRSIEIRRIGLGLCALAVLTLSAPAFGDETFQAGWMTGVLDGWGNRNVSTSVGGGSSVVWLNERVYITGNSYFADQSHFHRGTCEFCMEVWDGNRRLQGCSWGYQSGTWETPSERTDRSISFPVNMLSRGKHVLDLIIKVRLNGKTKTGRGTITLTVK